MKKVIKFLCLLLIAALIAILVLKNGAKADGNVESAGFDKESVDVDKEIQLTVKFPKAVTSCSGTFTCSGDGAVTDTSGRQSLEHLTGTTDSPTFTLIGATPGNVTINFNFTTVSYEDGTSDVNVTGSASTIVNGAEPVIEAPVIKPHNDITLQVNGEMSGEITTDVEVTWKSSDENVAKIQQNSGTSINIIPVQAGTSTITATNSAGSDSINVTVEGGGEDPQPPVEKFEVSPTSITSKGQTYVTPKNGQAGSATSTNESVATATVVDDGNSVLVDAIGEGEAEITITKKDSSEAAKVTVSIQGEQPPTPPTPVEGETPELNQSSITLNAGGESATIRVTNNVPVDWSIDKESSNYIALASNRTDTQVTVISKNSGTATVTATAKDGGKVATVSVTVNKSEQAAPTITPSGNIRLEVGKSVFLSANQGVNWSSGNSSVASVSSDGTVTAKGVGETRITATNGSGKSSSVTVTVVQASNGGGSGNESNSEEPANPDQGSETTSTFGISPTKTQTLNIGDTLQIKVTKGSASSWKSSKPAVATVDNNGKVTANSAGTTIITAVASDGSVAQVKVRVRDENGEVPEPDSESDEDVPSTGEASTELLLVLGVLTCVIAMFIFRKKTK